jgi:hypothetical protein
MPRDDLAHVLVEALAGLLELGREPGGYLCGCHDLSVSEYFPDGGILLCCFRIVNYRGEG